MERAELKAMLRGYEPATFQEEHDLAAMLDYARILTDPFAHTELPAHFTASALPVDPTTRSVLLLHHKKLDRWLQPGGHVDPDDATYMDAVLREVKEETGLAAALLPALPVPYDIDIHEIPARPEMPAHLHLDLRVIVRSSSALAIIPADGESERVRWFPADEALETAGDVSARRLIEKASFYLDW